MKDIDEPLAVIEENLGRESRDIMEVLLSCHATHLIHGIDAGLGIMIEGPPGCGKTTLLKSFYGLDGQIYRSDDLTPASFVSHDASRAEDELEEIDLLPKIRHKTLVCKDMATWFDGPEDTIREKWSVFAGVIDGVGYTRDTGTHGNRGYEGDYRFNFLGATTPIEPRGHRVMSHVGNRLLFTWMGGNGLSPEAEIEEVILGTDYEQKVKNCSVATRTYLRGLRQHYGGHGSVEWDRENTPSEVVSGITYLTELIRYARATVVDGEPMREGRKRPGSLLYDLARGHALLEGRETVLMDDLAVCARAALDTMPHRRRGVVRALVSPETGDTITTGTVEAYTGFSAPTARDYMDIVEDLGLGMVETVDEKFKPTKLTIMPGFEWPESLPYPDHANH